MSTRACPCFKLFIALTIAICAIATSARAATPIKGKDGSIEMKLPDGWRQTELPSDSPESLQLSAVNPKLNTAVIVAVEDAGDSSQKLDDYVTAALGNFTKKFSDATHTDPKPLKVNGKDAMRCEIKCSKDGQKVGCVLTVMKIGNHFERVEGWALQTDFLRLKAALGRLAEDVNDVPAAWTDAVVKGKDGTIQITLPGGWKQADIPRDSGADVQLMALNAAHQTGVMVIQMDRADIAQTLKANLDQTLEIYTKQFPDFSHTELKAIKVNGHNALQTDIQFSTSGIKLAYVITSIQTESHFDQVAAWCTQEKFAKLKPALVKLANGVKEISGPAVAANNDAPDNGALVVVLKGKDHRVQIALPAGWDRIDSPDPKDPLIQIAALDIKEATGLMVIVESRDKLTLNAKEYAQKCEDEMTASYGAAKPGEVTTMKVDDQDAAQFEFHGTASGTRLAYVVTVVQSDKNFTRVTAWTTESKLKRMKPLMMKLADGLKELPPRNDDQ